MIEVVQLEGLPREEWLAARRQGIGSSDVGGVCGLSRFASPLSVWLDKTGQAPEQEETDRMRRGRWLEDAVAQEWEHETHRATVAPTAMYRSAEHPFMLASPDRFVMREDSKGFAGVLEIKTSTVPELWETGPPKEVVLQATHQLVVTGHEQGWIAVLLNGRDFHQWQLHLDRRVAESLIEIESEFWQLVERREPPAADGHPATSDALARLYRDVEPDRSVDLTPLHETLVALRDVRARTKALERQQAELENTIKQALGTATVGLYNGAEVVTWRAGSVFDVVAFASTEPALYDEYRRQSVDLDRLKKERPDLDKRFRKANVGARRFLVKGSVK